MKAKSFFSITSKNVSGTFGLFCFLFFTFAQPAISSSSTASSTDSSAASSKFETDAFKNYFSFLNEISSEGPSLEFFEAHFGAYWDSDYARCEDKNGQFFVNFLGDLNESVVYWLEGDELDQLNSLYNKVGMDMVYLMPDEKINFCHLKYCAGYSCTEYYSFVREDGDTLQFELGIER